MPELSARCCRGHNIQIKLCTIQLPWTPNDDDDNTGVLFVSVESIEMS